MRIGILSRGEQLYSTQSLIKAAEKRGHTVKLLDIFQCVLSLDTNKPAIIYDNEELEAFDAIIPRIGAGITNSGATVIRQFEAMGTFSTTSSLGLLQSRDKLSTIQILAAQGIGVPKTIYPDYYTNHIKEVQYLGGFPVVIKTLTNTHGEGVMLVNSEKELNEAIDYMIKNSNRYIIQEYIKESRGKDTRAFIINGRVIACMNRTSSGEDFRSNLHLGGTPTKTQLDESTIDLAVQAAQMVGLAIAGVDIIESNRGPLVLEVNASPGLEGIETITGIDIAGNIIEFIEEQCISTKAIQQLF